jgi:hypothetical protein
MAFVGPKKRAELSTGVNSAGDEAVALVEDGGNDGVGWANGGIWTEELLIFTMFMMLDDRG